MHYKGKGDEEERRENYDDGVNGNRIIRMNEQEMASW